jgi:hypothetical protein
MDVDSVTESSVSPSQPQSQSYGGREPIPLMRSSVIVAMIMLLKAHLKTLYSLSEEWVHFPSLIAVVELNGIAIGNATSLSLGRRALLATRPLLNGMRTLSPGTGCRTPPIRFIQPTTRRLRKRL